MRELQTGEVVFPIILRASIYDKTDHHRPVGVYLFYEAKDARSEDISQGGNSNILKGEGSEERQLGDRR